MAVFDALTLTVELPSTYKPKLGFARASTSKQAQGRVYGHACIANALCAAAHKGTADSQVANGMTQRLN